MRLASAMDEVTAEKLSLEKQLNEQLVMASKQTVSMKELADKIEILMRTKYHWRRN